MRLSMNFKAKYRLPLIKGKGPEIARCGDKYMVDSIEEHAIVEQIGYFSAGLAPIAAETGILLTL